MTVPTVHALVDWDDSGDWTVAVDDISSRLMDVRRTAGRSADFQADAQGELTLKLLNTDRFFTPQRNLIENASFETGTSWWSNVAVADRPIRALYDGSVVHLWRMDEASSTVIIDYSGRGRDGGLTGGATRGWLGALNGDNSFGTGFDGTTGYGSVADSPCLLSSAYTSIHVWVLPIGRPAAGAYATIGQKNAPTGWWLRMNSDGYLLWGTKNGSAMVSSAVALPIAQWSYVSVTNHPTEGLQIIVNGADVTFGTLTTTFDSTSPDSVYIGADSVPTQYFYGALKDFAIITSPAWTVARAQGLYAAQNPAGLTGSGGVTWIETDAAPGAGSACLGAVLSWRFAGVHSPIPNYVARAGKPHSLSVSLKTPAGTARLIVGVGSASDPTDAATLLVTTSMTWQRVTVVWTPTRDVDDAIVFIRNEGSSPTLTLVDAVQLTAGSTSAAYVEGPTRRQLAQGRRVRVWATYGATDYALFTGVVERIVPNDRATQPFVTLYCRDMLFAMSKRTASLPAQTRTVMEARRLVLNQFLAPASENLLECGTNAWTYDWWGTFGVSAVGGATWSWIADGPAGMTAPISALVCTRTETAAGISQKAVGLWPKGTQFTASLWVKSLTTSTLSLTLTAGLGAGTQGKSQMFQIVQGVWTRLTMQAGFGASSESVVFGFTGSPGSTYYITRMILTTGEVVRALDTSPSPVIRHNLFDGLYPSPPTPLLAAFGYSPVQSPFLGLHESRLVFSQGYPTGSDGVPIPVDDLGTYGYRMQGWRIDPDGSDRFVTVSGFDKGPDGYSLWWTTGDTRASLPFSALQWITTAYGGRSGQGCWTELRGGFQKGRTYQFTAEISVGSPLQGGSASQEWSFGVFDADNPTDFSKSVGTFVSGYSVVTRTWTWTPARHVRRARLSLYVSSPGLSGSVSPTADNAMCMFTAIRCIEYPNTIGLFSPAWNGGTSGRTWPLAAVLLSPSGIHGYRLDMVANQYVEACLGFTATAGTLYRVTVSVIHLASSPATDLRMDMGALSVPWESRTVDSAYTSAIARQDSWQTITLDWTPTADQSDVRLRFVSAFSVQGKLYIRDIRISDGAVTYPWLSPIATLPTEEDEAIIPDHAITETTVLAALGSLNKDTGSRHYVVPTMTAPYFYEYRVTTIDAQREKATSETLTEADMQGLGEFVVGVESLANSIRVRTSTYVLDTYGLSQFTDRHDHGIAGDEASQLSHGYYPLNVDTNLAAVASGVTYGPVYSEYNRNNPLPIRLAAHLGDQHVESRARPTLKRSNAFPSMLQRLPDDIYDISNAALGLSGTKFNIQTQTLTVGLSGNLWTADEVLEEFPFAADRALVGAPFISSIGTIPQPTVTGGRTTIEVPYIVPVP